MVAEEAPCENLSPVVTEVSLRLQSALMVFLQLVWAQKSGPDLETDESRSVSPGGVGWESFDRVIFCVWSYSIGSGVELPVSLA